MDKEIEYIGETDTAAHGLVFIFSGDGKGKTTAALGMAMRAAGWCKPLILIQFMKKRGYGELYIMENMGDLVEFYQMGREEHVEKNNPAPEDIELVGRGMKMARESVESRQYDFIFLDEVITAMDYGLVKEKELLEFIASRPSYLHIVLTGRGATPALIDAADCVTIMEKVKHHYDKGIKAQKGVEY